MKTKMERLKRLAKAVLAVDGQRQGAKPIGKGRLLELRRAWCLLAPKEGLRDFEVGVFGAEVGAWKL